MRQNDTGMSLIEVTVSMGITAIMALAIGSIIVNQAKFTHALEKKIRNIEAGVQTQSILSVPKLCTASFSGMFLAPTEKGLENFCYNKGINLTFNPVAGTSQQRGLIKEKNGFLFFEDLILEKFCLQWVNTLEVINDPPINGVLPEPSAISGFALLFFQAENKLGIPLPLRKFPIKMSLRRADPPTFNIKSVIGSDFSLAEPTTDPIKDGSVRPVKAAYKVQSCVLASEGDSTTAISQSGVGYKETKDFVANFNFFTVPAGVNSILVELWGAGGGGVTSCPNNYSGSLIRGGGGGGYAAKLIGVAPGQTYTVIVGSYGAGQSSSFALNGLPVSLIASGGGSGQPTGTKDDAGLGGSGLGGDINLQGTRGKLSVIGAGGYNGEGIGGSSSRVGDLAPVKLNTFSGIVLKPVGEGGISCSGALLNTGIEGRVRLHLLSGDINSIKSDISFLMRMFVR